MSSKSMLPTLDEIQQAPRSICGAATRTPLVRLNVFDAAAEIYLKLENLQPIGSFKIRGATNAMAHMPPEQLARGVLTASAGNMAHGVAWRARELGIPCTVVAPDTAPETKVKAIERLGARVIKVPFERWWQTFAERAYPGVDATFIHAFDDLYVMAGNGTIALEILEDLPDVDTIVIPGGGAGVAGGGGVGPPAACERSAPVAGSSPPRSRWARHSPRLSPRDRRRWSTTSRHSWTASAARPSFRKCSNARKD